MSAVMCAIPAASRATVTGAPSPVAAIVPVVSGIARTVTHVEEAGRGDHRHQHDDEQQPEAALQDPHRSPSRRRHFLLVVVVLARVIWPF